jgi:hypothetical protein
MARERKITLRPTLGEWAFIILAVLQPLAVRAYWAVVLVGCVAGAAIGIWRIVKLLGYQLEYMQDASEDTDETPNPPPPGQRHGHPDGPMAHIPDPYRQ